MTLEDYKLLDKVEAENREARARLGGTKLTVWDHYAAAALGGLITFASTISARDVATEAAQAADKLLEERKRRMLEEAKP